MDAGRCRQCGRAFSSGEVTGVGILRPRLAGDGGPIVEFACPACRTMNLLIPHGHGRFAPPGAPPPPPPSDEERRVPWRRAETAASAATADPARNGGPAHASSSSSARVATEPAAAPPSARPAPAAPDKASDPAGEPKETALPLDVADALAVLGLGINASRKEIERAFRRLALTCHPDKVAHLDADFVALAERKFKRLQAARDLLLEA
jgi:DnaJ-domain-containing protein 1